MEKINICFEIADCLKQKHALQVEKESSPFFHSINKAWDRTNSKIHQTGYVIYESPAFSKYHVGIHKQRCLLLYFYVYVA